MHFGPHRPVKENPMRLALCIVLGTVDIVIWMKVWLIVYSVHMVVHP